MTDNNPNIEWRRVAEYPYEVSNDGQVRRIGARIPLRPGVSRGYSYVILSANGNRRAFRIHKLVAVSFLGPCPQGHQVNHQDGNKANNLVSNLEYCTEQANHDHAVRTGLSNSRGSSNPNAKLTEDQAREIISLHAAGENQDSLARRFNVSYPTVNFLVRGITWKHLARD